MFMMPVEDFVEAAMEFLASKRRRCPPFSHNYVSENCLGSLMKAVSQCAATKKAHPGVVALREPNLFIHMTLEASFAGAFVGASANTFFLSRSLKIHG